METILAATDFSKPANSAVDYAANLARVLNCKLVLVNAFKLPLAGYDMAAPLESISDLRREAERNLSRVKDLLISNSYDFDIAVYAGLGAAPDVILEASNKYGAELIVMGMTGEAGGIKQHLMGSNTLRCARELSLPLLVVSEYVSYKPIQHICLAARPEDMAGSTLLYSARDIANMFNASLEIVIVEKRQEKAAPHSTNTSPFIEKALKGIAHKQVLLLEDDKVKALEYYFKFHETDLVIVHPKKRHVLNMIFSPSVTDHLAFHIKVPLLVLH